MTLRNDAQTSHYLEQVLKLVRLLYHRIQAAYDPNQPLTAQNMLRHHEVYAQHSINALLLFYHILIEALRSSASQRHILPYGIECFAPSRTKQFLSFGLAQTNCKLLASCHLLLDLLLEAGGCNELVHIVTVDARKVLLLFLVALWHLLWINLALTIDF